MGTTFQEIYDRFLGKITEDMYGDYGSAWTKEDTLNDLENIFKDALPGFEFPRFALYDFDEKLEQYNCTLTQEEINIIADLMLVTWLSRQIDSIENTRQKYTGTDFKMTSQANHLAKLLTLKAEDERVAHHDQRLYKRRKLDDKGMYSSNWSIFLDSSALDG